MESRSDFAKKLANLELQHLDRAIALLWYYRHTQQYDERTASDLVLDLADEHFPRPNVTRLEKDLKGSPYTIRGKRKGSFQLDIRKIQELDDRYLPLLNKREIKVSGDLLPPEWFTGTRSYLEQLVLQMNGSYELGWFDACAVLARRLMESLIIEVYISQKRHSDIQSGGTFLALERLIAHIRSDSKVVLSRGAPATMQEVKQIGDTAAHDRTYITQPIDVNDIKVRYRRLIQELLILSGIKK
jgi:hypothetical protein